MISIHALLAESDGQQSGQEDKLWQFLSTLSLRRATDAPEMPTQEEIISIHALLAESDIRGIVLKR